MFNIDYSSLFQNLSPAASTFLIAMLPISELRGAIPWALSMYQMPVLSAFFWAVLGNIFPIVFVLWLLDPIAQFLSNHSRFFKKFFDWLFTRTRKRFEKQKEKYGPLVALMIFVAIPLPITGAWTGSVAAFLFGIPYRKAIVFIFLGMIISGIIISLASLGILGIFQNIILL